MILMFYSSLFPFVLIKLFSDLIVCCLCCQSCSRLVLPGNRILWLIEQAWVLNYHFLFSTYWLDQSDQRFITSNFTITSSYVWTLSELINHSTREWRICDCYYYWVILGFNVRILLVFCSIGIYHQMSCHFQ
jgi:hypothetical protein